MEFIKCGKNYMIKGSNGRVVSEKEKLQLENDELILQDIKGCNCQKETTKKIKENKKKIKEIEEIVNIDNVLDITALNNEVQNDTIEETN